jgi:hypothetical protein
MFGCRRDAVTGRGRKLHEEFHDWCSLPNVIRAIIARRAGDAGHVARIGKNCVQGFGVET